MNEKVSAHINYTWEENVLSAFVFFNLFFREKKKNTGKRHWKISQNNGNIAFKNIPIVLLKNGKTQLMEKRIFRTALLYFDKSSARSNNL